MSTQIKEKSEKTAIYGKKKVCWVHIRGDKCLLRRNEEADMIPGIKAYQHHRSSHKTDSIEPLQLLTKSKRNTFNKGTKNAASRVTSLHLRAIVGHRGRGRIYRPNVNVKKKKNRSSRKNTMDKPDLGYR